MDFAAMNTNSALKKYTRQHSGRSSSFPTHQKHGRKGRDRKTICSEGTVRYGIENWVTFTTMGPSAASNYNKLQRIPPVIPERPKFVKLQRQPPIIPERPTIRNNNSVPDWFVTHLNTGRSNTQTRTVCNGDWVNCCYNCGRQFSILSGYSSMCETCRL